MIKTIRGEEYLKAVENNLKTITGIHQARREDISNLITYLALPISPRGLETVEPFILLNHHGLQVYPPNNQGLPFGPHPHRGFETVTFIYKGDLVHRDSTGYESLIKAGGVQWMTAGSGLIHNELSSDEFKKTGGELEILQLWINLPSKSKMSEPNYIGLQKEDLPAVELDEGKVTVNLISGEWNNVTGVIKPISDVNLSSIHLQAKGKFSRTIASGRSVLLYLVSGTVSVNGQTIKARETIEFDLNGGTVEVAAITESVIIFGDALPNNEPIVSHGPFVMNSKTEIIQAIEDYQAGKFGEWKF